MTNKTYKIYFLGSLKNGFRTFPKSDLFDTYYNNSAKESELFDIKRLHNNTSLYIYIKYGLITAQEDGRTGSFFGLAVEMPNEYITNPLHIKTILKSAYSNMLKEETLIGLNSYSIPAFIPYTLSDVEEYINSWTKNINSKISPQLDEYIKEIPNDVQVTNSKQLDMSSDIESDSLQQYLLTNSNIRLADIYKQQAPQIITDIESKQKQLKKLIEKIKNSGHPVFVYPPVLPDKLTIKQAETINAELDKIIITLSSQLSGTEINTDNTQLVSNNREPEKKEDTKKPVHTSPTKINLSDKTKKYGSIILIALIFLILGIFLITRSGDEDKIENNPIADTTTTTENETVVVNPVDNNETNNSTVIANAKQKEKKKFDALMKKINGEKYLGGTRKEYTKAIELLRTKHHNFIYYKRDIKDKIGNLENERIFFVRERQVKDFIKFEPYNKNTATKFLKNALIADSVTVVSKNKATTHKLSKKWINAHKVDETKFASFGKDPSKFQTPYYIAKAMINRGDNLQEIAGRPLENCIFDKNFRYTFEEVKKINKK